MNALLSQRPDGWKSPCCEGHGVHFYADRQELAERVHEHVMPMLERGQAAVVVAGRDNMLTFERFARSKGLDIQRFRNERRLLLFDAQWLMGRFMLGDRPDPRRFRAIVGGQLRTLSLKYPGIHIYGEMEALMMAKGDPDAAMELERLWNELAGEVRFNLLCAYPLDLFVPDDHHRTLERVRKAHNYTLRTIPT